MTSNPTYTAERLDFYSDHRGCVFEPLHHLDLVKQGNVHLALTEPGAIRGNHYHTRGVENLTVMGPALVRLSDQGQRRDFAIALGEIWRFVIPPGVTHAVKNTGGAPCALIAFSTEVYRPEAKHTVTDIILE